MTYLADTHVLIWWLVEPRRLSGGQKRAAHTPLPSSPKCTLPVQV